LVFWYNTGMKKFFGVVLIIIVVLAVYFFYGKKTEAPILPDDEHADLFDNKDYLISASKSALVGFWRNNEDANFTREFEENGIALDRYEGENDQGVLTWDVFTKEKPDAEFSGEYENGTAYLVMSNGTDNLYFKIIKITPEELELVFMDGGGVLTFSREKLIACTMEAKLCPDGSAVGRTGPNCEFAPCP